MIYLYHSFHAAEVTVKHKMADCEERNTTNQDGISLTEIILDSENENKFRSNFISGVCLNKCLMFHTQKSGRCLHLTY